ncbi:OLC1v1018467C1 [Oldenlandia corymbosa var. corymbosa]|uniref:OLC1v1018467C1 n=1 Tax=Oldenlandia corymbosa var. corymbosa TaxID=529605 RepID=A0AAV1EBN0_OLDCO|nr:OLC1v1018467C1 [Oldenlandia corymbosa var. corymbosa]
MSDNIPKIVSLERAYKVDEAINTRKDHIVIIRFGQETEDKELPQPEKVDQWLKAEASHHSRDDVRIFKVEMKDVPELKARYRLSEPCTLLFFRNNVQVDRRHGKSLTPEEIKKIIDRLLVEKKNAPKPPARPAPPARTNDKNTHKPNKSIPQRGVAPVSSDTLRARLNKLWKRS